MDNKLKENQADGLYFNKNISDNIVHLLLWERIKSWLENSTFDLQ